ncbi:transcriptional regulator, AlpA family [Albimonas donghaensis]|uniref:Transcriptional regulator, AlpA family n=1 Tax=Albimonas donghaensis TaxID=356660 RepID=A0A1H3DV59_9RHOB|nr:AlpA family transcriptional regulator [Albimonas donghaensis]SDX69564.1 transcriptional regulator, AlpA family [Albimonas donghaensis]
MAHIDRILRRREVETLISLSRSTIYMMIADGSFPRPIRLGKRAVGWRESIVLAWLESRKSSQAE